MTTTTGSAASAKINLVQITERGNIVGERWSEDGQSVIYASWVEGAIDYWWEYKVSTGEHHHIPPPFNLTPRELWTRLEADFPGEAFVWFGGGLSPSGTRVVYNRLPPSHNYTPAPNEFYLPPYEIWAARSDGSGAAKLQSCYRVSQVIWLDQENKVIFSCGYEGPSDIGIANVDGSSFVDLTGMLGGLGLMGRMALSPDETKLAVTDSLERVQIVHLENKEIQLIAEIGWVSGWSPDSRRLYYQRADSYTDPVDIYVYDLDTGISTKVISSPILAPDGMELKIPIGVEVSPLEKAAIFHQFQGLWLVVWSQ